MYTYLWLNSGLIEYSSNEYNEVYATRLGIPFYMAVNSVRMDFEWYIYHIDTLIDKIPFHPLITSDML